MKKSFAGLVIAALAFSGSLQARTEIPVTGISNIPLVLEPHTPLRLLNFTLWPVNLECVVSVEQSTPVHVTLTHKTAVVDGEELHWKTNPEKTVYVNDKQILSLQAVPGAEALLENQGEAQLNASCNFVRPPAAKSK